MQSLRSALLFVLPPGLAAAAAGPATRWRHQDRELAGDGLDVKEWVWDGTRFVRTEESTNGLCRMVVAGGPWSLPTLASEGVPPAGTRTNEEQRK